MYNIFLYPILVLNLSRHIDERYEWNRNGREDVGSVGANACETRTTSG